MNFHYDRYGLVNFLLQFHCFSLCCFMLDHGWYHFKNESTNIVIFIIKSSIILFVLLFVFISWSRKILLTLCWYLAYLFRSVAIPAGFYAIWKITPVCFFPFFFTNKGLFLSLQIFQLSPETIAHFWTTMKNQ